VVWCWNTRCGYRWLGRPRKETRCLRP
jgi:hypothetical protein